MAKSDSEDLNRLQQASARQRHIDSMTLPAEVGQAERELFQQRANACNTQLQNLQGQWDAPRRKLFPPPMSGQWRGALAELELRQAEVTAQWEEHTSAARSYSVLLARVHAEERRAMFSVSQLHRQGWNVTAVMPVVAEAKRAFEESQEQASSGDYGQAVDTLTLAHDSWDATYSMAQQALTETPESMAELADKVLRVSPDGRSELQGKYDLAAQLFAKKNTEYLAIVEKVREHILRGESEAALTEDFVSQSLAKLTGAAEVCWKLHRAGVPVADTMDQIDAATESVHLRPHDERTRHLVECVVEKVTELESQLARQQSGTDSAMPHRPTMGQSALEATSAEPAGESAVESGR